MGKGKLVIFSAPSGAGKTTLVKHLLASGLNLGFSVSATSRQQREGETDGKHVIFDVDVVGGLNIKRFYGADALSVFVMPPSPEVLEERLRNRSTENEESLVKRLDKARHELGFASRFDRILVNDDLEKAKEEALAVVRDFIDG